MAYGDNIFTAIIDEQGVIWEAGTGRKRQSVGIDSQKEQDYINTISEMQETIDNYYSKLVELGVIQQPKTPEEIAREQAAQQMEINQALLEEIKNIKNELGVLRDGNGRNGSKLSNNAVGQDSEGNRKVSTGSKKRTGAGKEDTAGTDE